MLPIVLPFLQDGFMELRNEFIGDDPIEIFKRWLEEAGHVEPNDPNAAALATSTKDGVPSVRMVLIKDVQPAGFSFFTNAASRKGVELAENPHAALCLHWKSLRRQIRVTGEVSLLPDDTVDRYFHSRSRASQIAAVVSEQSQVLPSRDVLERRVQEYTQAHPEGEIPRPCFWCGYLLKPNAIEFWINGTDRLHDRLYFERTGNYWTTSLLYP
jgi:pyridoxamine 5'-phosphate oxidase